MKENNKVFYAAILVACIMMIPLSTMQTDDEINTSEIRTWNNISTILLGEEGDPGEGESGILEVFFVNHTADAKYVINDSSVIEGWCDANGFSESYGNSNPLSFKTPHDNAFDIVVRVRGNATICMRGDTWWHTDLRVFCNISSDGDITPEPDYATYGLMTLYEPSVNNSDYEYLWCNFYMNGSGDGYELTKDGTFTINDITLQAYY